MEGSYLKCPNSTFLPDDHILIQRRTRSERTVINQARTVCEQCGMCTELCPRHMIGHELPPHLIVRAVGYEQISAPSAVVAALTCSECAICEAWSCPVEISPMRLNQMLKVKLREEGIRYEGELRPEDPMAQHRMLPVKRLVRRLELTEYMHKAPMTDEIYAPQQVIIPLRQHIEAPGAVRRVRGREPERRGREGRGDRTLLRVGGSAWAGRSLRPPSYQDPAGLVKAPCSHVPCANVRFIRFLSVPRTPDL